MKHELYRFQYHTFFMINRERLIAFSDSNEAHTDLLKRLWAATFPAKNWEGPVGDHWKTMGFQVKK